MIMADPATTTPRSPRPLSIKVIAIMYVGSGVWTAISVVVGALLGGGGAALIGGLFVFGGPAAVYNFAVLVCVPLLLGIGLWRLRETARRLAAWYQGYLIVNSLLAMANPTTRTQYVQQTIRNAGEVDPALIEPMLHTGWFMSLSISIVVSGLILWLLIKRKTAFAAPATSVSSG